MNAGVFGLFIFSSIATSTCEDRDAKLRFYHGSFDKYTELPIDEADKIFETTWYNSSRSTVIFAHGFTGVPTGAAVTAVTTTYIELKETNVALLNWEYLASSTTSSIATSYASWAAPNARKLGVRLAETFLVLSDAGLDLNNTHLIGHSLGAHIWGIAGFNLLEKGIQLPWITGLDPAALGFEKKPFNQRLSVLSAIFVDIIHTDPNKYGMRTSAGTVDFWPNYKVFGPVTQPGCTKNPVTIFSPEDLCNHHRSWQLLVDALKHPGTLIGSYARNYKTWKKYSKNERRAVTLPLGKYDEEVYPGNYYLVTNSESPYGLGEDGL